MPGGAFYPPLVPSILTGRNHAGFGLGRGHQAEPARGCLGATDREAESLKGFDSTGNVYRRAVVRGTGNHPPCYPISRYARSRRLRPKQTSRNVRGGCWLNQHPRQLPGAPCAIRIYWRCFLHRVSLVAACSDRTEEKAHAAAISAATDIAHTASSAGAAVFRAAKDVSGAADKAGNEIGKDATRASDKTGAALQRAGKKLRD